MFQIHSLSNLSGTARFEKRPDPGRFTNRPYGWYGEIVCFETLSDTCPAIKPPGAHVIQ